MPGAIEYPLAPYLTVFFLPVLGFLTVLEHFLSPLAIKQRGPLVVPACIQPPSLPCACRIAQEYIDELTRSFLAAYSGSTL